MAFLPPCSSLRKVPVWKKSVELSHSLAAPLGRLGHFLLLLNAGFIIEPPFLDLGEKSFFGELFLEISDCLFYLIILDNNFHRFFSFSYEV